MNSAKATMIDQLPNQEGSNNSNDSQLVDNILKEIGDGNDQNNSQLNYQMDEQAQLQMQQQQMQQQMEQQQMEQQQMQQMNMQQQMPDDEYHQPNSLTSSIIDQLKQPILVAVLVLLASLPFTGDLISKYVPKTIDVATGKLNMVGLLVKALLFGVLYFGTNKFI